MKHSFHLDHCWTGVGFAAGLIKVWTFLESNSMDKTAKIKAMTNSIGCVLVSLSPALQTSMLRLQKKSLSKRTNTLSSVPNMLMCLGSPLLQQVVVQPSQKNLLPNTWAIQIKEKKTNISRKKTAIPNIRYDQQPRQVQTIQQYIIVSYHCQNKWIYSSSYNLTKRRNRWHKQDAQQYNCKSSKTLTTEPHFEGTDNVSWRKKAAVGVLQLKPRQMHLQNVMQQKG